MKEHWAAASFKTTFLDDPFGPKCDVCDRQSLLKNTFSEDPVGNFKLWG